MQQRIFQFFSLLLFVLSLPLHAAVYQGTVGNSPVTFDLELRKQDSLGSYFYDKYRIDIPFQGSFQKGLWVLTEGWPEGGKNNPRLQLKQSSPTTLTGTWYNPRSKVSLPIILQKVDESAASMNAKLQAVRIKDELLLYERIRFAAIKPQVLKTESWMQHTLQWYQEPLSKIQYFTLANPRASAGITKINSALEQNFWQTAREYFQCAFYGDWDYSIEPTYLSTALVSFTDSTFVFCGGAHPDSSMIGYNFDAKTGKRLSLAQALGRSESNLSTWLLNTMNTLHPKEMRSDICSYQDLAAWEISEDDWYVTPKGIVVYPGINIHALRACKFVDWAVIPFNQLASAYR